jgi:ComF family protein
VQVFQILHRNIFIPVWHFIYPPVCFTCHQMLTDGESKVCTQCWKSFQPIHPGDEQWIEMVSKFQMEGVVRDFFSCYLFEKEGKFQEVIHLLKYQGMKSLGLRLGMDIGSRISNSQMFSDADYLVPVPLHKLKQRERGYNQSEWICRGIAQEMRIPIQTDFLKRRKYTQSQTQLNLEQRKENVGDAFKINEKCISKIKGKTIILVDDVITTGSTINACAKELIANGAEKIIAASAAVAK